MNPKGSVNVVILCIFYVQSSLHKQKFCDRAWQFANKKYKEGDDHYVS